MISSVFALKEANTIPEYLVSNTETRLEENYYFNDSLKFLLECHSELLSCRQTFYKIVLENANENPYIVNESFNDVMNKIKEIIKKILAYIESLVKRFITSLNKFVSSDRYIIRMKKEISKFPKDKSFDISGYNYTLNDRVPVVDIIGLNIDDIQTALRDLEKTNASDVEITKLNNALAIYSSEERMDEIRSQILNVDYKITESSYANEVFAIYRDGKSEESTISIDKAEVDRALNEYEGYKTKIKEVNRLQANIRSKYKSLETSIDNMINNTIMDSINKSGADSATKANLKNSLNTLIGSQVQTVQRIANMHVQAIAAKLDAYNSLVLQDRNILYRALSIVQKDINNMRIMENYTGYDYTRDGIYKGYVLEKYFMNKEQQRFVEECLALSESKIPELTAINEDLKMDKKNMFERIKNVVKTIFEKFMMKMNSFIMNDKKFLNKYKDIILTKKVEPYKLNNMPNYEAGIKNIKEHKIPKLDIKNMLSETETDIQKKILSTYTGDGDFVDFAKKYFLSNNEPNKEEIESSTLKMAEIYAFCIGAEAAINTLKNDLNTFSAAAESAKNAVLNALPKNEAIDIVGEKYYYSTVLEAYINEADDKGTETDSNNSTANLKLDVPKQDNKATDNANLEKDVKSDDKGKTDDQQAKENKNTEAKKVEETAKWYLNTIKTVCTAKITAFQKIYSEYMKILRYHVKAATGSLGNASNFTEEDQKNIRAAMKEYNEAKDNNSKKAAEDKIINIYKSKNMVIDAHDVQTLVDKNKNNLG